jgi:cyclase
MLRPRVIPSLLLKGDGLVKTTKFRKPIYVGDPINAVKIFNDKEVDELLVLDISASVEGREPNFAVIEEIANECFMPLSYGGGVSSFEQAAKIYSLGVEKIIFNTAAFVDSKLIKRVVEEFGAQSVVVSIDVYENLFRNKKVFVKSGTVSTKEDPIVYAKKIELLGVGEIIINSINHEGTMKGYDLELVSEVAKAVRIPVVAAGGAGSLEDFKEAFRSGVQAVSAGSFFVFHGPNRAVLINYLAEPEVLELID